MLAKGKAKVGYVLPEGLIERIRYRAFKKKARPSQVVEELLTRGLESVKDKGPDPEPAAT